MSEQTAQLTMPTAQLMREHRALLVGSGLVWLLFAVMEIGKSLFFSSGAVPAWYYSLQAVYIFLPWFLFSLLCGFIAERSASLATRSTQFILATLPFGVAIALIHISLLTSTYWLFWPQQLTQVTVSFVFVEQLLKWGHFELLAFYIFIFVWRRRIQERSNQLSAHAMKSNGHLLFSTDEGIIKLESDEIEWLLADDNYVIVHADNRKIRIRSTLKELMQKLDSDLFRQTHRSAIVNLNRVSRVTSNRIVLNSGAKVPISRRRHKPLLEELNLLGSA